MTTKKGKKKSTNIKKENIWTRIGEFITFNGKKQTVAIKNEKFKNWSAFIKWQTNRKNKSFQATNLQFFWETYSTNFVSVGNLLSQAPKSRMLTTVANRIPLTDSGHLNLTIRKTSKNLHFNFCHLFRVFITASWRNCKWKTYAVLSEIFQHCS